MRSVLRSSITIEEEPVVSQRLSAQETKHLNELKVHSFTTWCRFQWSAEMRTWPNQRLASWVLAFSLTLGHY